MTTQLVSAAHISRLEAEDKPTFCTDCSLRLSFFFLFFVVVVVVCFASFCFCFLLKKCFYSNLFLS